MSKAHDENRFKLLRVSTTMMCDALGFNAINGRRSFGLSIEGMPENYVIGRVWDEFQSDSFVFQVFHESFPVVSCGMVPEYLVVSITSCKSHDTSVGAIRTGTMETISGISFDIADDRKCFLTALDGVPIDDKPAPQADPVKSKKSWEFLGAP